MVTRHDTKASSPLHLQEERDDFLFSQSVMGDLFVRLSCTEQKKKCQGMLKIYIFFTKLLQACFLHQIVLTV